MTEEFLARELKMSRTPIREALVELKGLGMLELRKNRGAVVAPLTEQKIREIFEVRRIMEVEATRKCVGLIDQGAVAKLREETVVLLEEWGEDKGWGLDGRIHDCIADSCGNRRLCNEIGRYALLMHAVRNAVGLRLPVQRITVEQHLVILSEIADGSANAAASAMDRHVRQAEESAVVALA